jgi:uncharacterized protein YneF (UPF0154 family)
MKPIDTSRLIIVLLLALILAAFLAGTLCAFSPAQAALFSADSPTMNPTDTFMPTPASTPTHLPTPIVMSADTTGIIALAILVVVVTLVGMVWGGAIFRRKKITSK